MSRNFKRKFGAIIIVFCTIFLISCSNDEDIAETIIEGTKLEAGAIIKYDNEDFKNLNIDGNKYSEVTSDSVIINYDTSSERYVYSKENNHYIYYDHKIEEINEESYKDIILSPKAKYVSYFIENEGNQLVIKEIGAEKKLEVKSNVAISGEVFDWVDENRVVYYGIDYNGVNGVFIYNVETQEEKLLYKLDEGIVQFVKGTQSGVVFLQENNDKGKILKKIDVSTGEVEVLTENLQEISDIVFKDDEIYILGKFKKDIFSLYKLENSKETRLVYDFPQAIKGSKGLSQDKDGNILFVGVNSDINKEEVYVYQADGSIRALTASGSEYIFVQN